MITRRGAFLLGALSLAAALYGCDTESTSACYPGDQRACTCPGGGSGFERCDDAGDAYGECACSGSGGAGGSGGQGGAGVGGQGGGALLPFMAECMDSAQCESELCYEFNSKGSHCTKKCSTDGDCPSPSPGCNGMGVCRAP